MVSLETVTPPMLGKESLLMPRFMSYRAPPFEVLFPFHLGVSFSQNLER